MEENVLKSNSCTQQLPNELLFYITKYLRDEDSVALSLCGAVKGFTAFYSQNRKHIISNRCFFLTPSKWNVYLKSHIHANAVTSFNVNHLYWLPGQLLADAITQMKKLEELSVNDTKVSLPILAKILNTCIEITKLDFSFRFEDDWKNLQDYGVRKVILDSMAQNFKRITCLKVSTCVCDAGDYNQYNHDPWKAILLFLSKCRDCVDLNVEITYSDEEPTMASATRARRKFHPGDRYDDIKQFIRETIYPHLDWMTSLKSLVLTKHGDSTDDYESCVKSLMLNDLLMWLFSEDPERVPRSLQHLWIQDFYFKPKYQSIHQPAPSLKSFQILDRSGEIFSGPNSLSQFSNLEFVAKVNFSENCSLLHLPNLKYVDGSFYNANEPILTNFARTHPNLECISIFADYAHSAVKDLNLQWNLPNLKVLIYSRSSIDKEIVESFVKVYSNLETLCLINEDRRDDISMVQDCLSSIKFPNLTSLSLRRFKFHDGAFLLQVIKQCPKLQRIDLDEADEWEPTMFISNLDLFLPLAEKLRDFRLEGKFEGNGSVILSLLKSFFKHSPKLERLFLLDTSYKSSPTWVHPSEMADTIVRFASEMPHLVALCIVFKDLCSDLIEEVNRRIVEEDIFKPSLWFYLNSKCRPNPSNSTVPFVHYQEMVYDLNYSWSPPKIEFSIDS